MFNSKFKLKWKPRLYGNQECSSWSKYILHKGLYGIWGPYNRRKRLGYGLWYSVLNVSCIGNCHSNAPFADKFGFVWQQQPCCFSDTSASQPLMMIKVSEGLWSTFPLHPFRGLPLLQQHPHPVYFIQQGPCQSPAMDLKKCNLWGPR